MPIRLVGIYEAEGSLLGELRYVVGKLMGTRHCSLCDITHGRVRKKPAFTELEARSPAPIVLLHLDELDDAQRMASRGQTPCVLLDGPTGLELLLDTHALERAAGSVEQFEAELHAALAARGRGEADS